MYFLKQVQKSAAKMLHGTRHLHHESCMTMFKITTFIDHRTRGDLIKKKHLDKPIRTSNQYDTLTNMGQDSVGYCINKLLPT